MLRLVLVMNKQKNNKVNRMSWNPSPVLGNANWFGNSGLATKNQLLSSVQGLYNDIQDFEFSTISIKDLKVSTLTANSWISSPIINVSSVIAEHVYTSTLQVSSMTIPGAEITNSGIFISTGNFSFVGASTLRFSALGDSNQLFGDLNVDLGLGSFLGGVVGNLGGLLGGTIGAITGTIGMATGIAGLTQPRTVNNITPGTFETLNGTSQIQISTLGYEYPLYSSIYRLTSTTTYFSNVPLGVEVFVSTIFPAGTKCMRTMSDPLNLPTAPTSTIQAFSQWVPLLDDDYNLKFSTITTSSLTAQSYILSPHFYNSGYGLNGLGAGIGATSPINIQAAANFSNGTAVGLLQVSPYMSSGSLAGISRLNYTFSNFSTSYIHIQPNSGSSPVDAMIVSYSNTVINGATIVNGLISTSELTLAAGFGGPNNSGNISRLNFSTLGGGGGTLHQAITSLYEGGTYGLSIQSLAQNSTLNTLIRCTGGDLYGPLSNLRVGVLCNSPQYTLDVNGNTNIAGDLNVAGNIFGSNFSTFIPVMVSDKIVIKNELISTVLKYTDIDIITDFYKPDTYVSSIGWVGTSNLTSPYFINNTTIGSIFSTLLVGQDQQSTFATTASLPNSTIVDYYQSNGAGTFRYYQNGGASYIDQTTFTGAYYRFTFNYLSNSWYFSGSTPTPPYGYENIPFSSIVGTSKMRIDTGQDYNEIYSNKPLFMSSSRLHAETISSSKIYSQIYTAQDYINLQSTQTGFKEKTDFYSFSTNLSSIGWINTVSSGSVVYWTPESNYYSTLVNFNPGAAGFAGSGLLLNFADFTIQAGQSNPVTWAINYSATNVSTFGPGLHRLSNNNLAFPNNGWNVIPMPTDPYGTTGANYYTYSNTTEFDIYNTISSTVFSTNQSLYIQAQDVNMNNLFTSSISTTFQSFYLPSTFETFAFSGPTLLSSLISYYNVPGSQKDRQLSFGFSVTSNDIIPVGGGAVYGTPFTNPYPNNLVFFVCNFGFGNFTAACDVSFQLEAQGTTVVNESLCFSNIPPTGNITRILQLDGGNLPSFITNKSPLSPVLFLDRQLTGNELVYLNGITFYI